MTALVESPGGRASDGRRGFASQLNSPALGPMVLALAGAVAFVIVRPAVGDLWAARARQSAAAHGVGLTYWFSWFGGGSTPGNYSVLTPYLSVLFGAALLGAFATVAITPLCWRLVQGTSHPLAATWLATIAAGFSLWSGRIPFAVGSAIAAATLIAVRDGRRWRAAAGAALAVLASPVCGAFIAFGLLGTFAAARPYRGISATTILAAGFGLGLVAVLYGAPGPEGFTATEASIAALGLLLFLLARPSRHLIVVILLALAACPLLAVIPNGMGSNFERLVWICLPVAVVATSRVRQPLGLLTAACAVAVGAWGTISDVRVAQQPTSTVAYYASLGRELDALPRLPNYRVEVVADGTHTAAYAMLAHAALARGYETQVDNALNPVLQSKTDLNATSYRAWLDNNSVGYVALPTVAVHPSAEYRLVSRGGLHYLYNVWSDSTWTLLGVHNPNPIVAPPAQMLDADQSNIVIDVPHPGQVHIRVRWSRFLDADGPAPSPDPEVRNDGYGWTILTATQPGHYELHGEAAGILP